jgi:hypothetical protein
MRMQQNSNITTQTAGGNITISPEAMEASVKEYCLGCYWPFVDTMVSIPAGC